MIRKFLTLLCGLGVSAPLAFSAGAGSSATLANLQAAFQGESNAHARYLAFAEKADEEGYAGVASLFRAASLAEEIHAGNHAAVIKNLGAAPLAQINAPKVGSTAENLKAAIQGETYERDEMYPAFVQQATSDQNTSALESFRSALAAEAEHARLYTEALGNLESMTYAVTYYVCPVCGFTTPDPNLGYCPTCATPEERFKQVS